MAEALGTEATTEGTATETVVEGAATETAATETAPVDEWGDPEQLPEDQDLFPRKYVEELRDREAKYRIKARDFNTQFEEYGGSDAVREAVELKQQLSTDDGVIAMFIESGRALGLGIKDMESLFGQAAEAAGSGGTELDGLEDTDTLTVADARRMVQEAIQQQVIAPQQEQQFQGQVAEAQRAVHDTIAELKIPAEDIDAVLVAGQKYLPDGDYDPAHVAAAVRRGNEDYNAQMEKRAAAYLAGKKTVVDTTPSSTGASTSGGTALPEPKSVEEGSKRARERLRLSGEPVR